MALRLQLEIALVTEPNQQEDNTVQCDDVGVETIDLMQIMHSKKVRPASPSALPTHVWKSGENSF